MRIGFVGAGAIGQGLARLATAAGYRVSLSNSRGPQTLTDPVEELGPGARAAIPTEAATAGELVVVSVHTEGPVGGTGGATGRQACPRRDQLHPTARRTDTGTVRRPTQ